MGRHNGLIHYTIGQRKGLGISSYEPLYDGDIVLGGGTIQNRKIQVSKGGIA